MLRRPGTTRQARVLPLSSDVGQAVAAYRRHGRPTPINRPVVRHCRAPCAPLAAAAALRRLATRAVGRAGVTAHPRLGAPTFRHPAASQLVNRGASFKDVADVLGHPSRPPTGSSANAGPGDVHGGGPALERRGVMTPSGFPRPLDVSLDAYLRVREALGCADAGGAPVAA